MDRLTGKYLLVFFIALVLCALAGWVFVQNYPMLAIQELPFDSQITYLPLAREFLDSGLAVFSNPQSVHVPPGSYLYMALVGADPDNVRLLNLGMAMASVFMIYLLVSGVSGSLAGLFAASFYALNPFLHSILIQPLSEPPFIFFSLLWLLGLVQACNSQRPLAWILLSVLGLSCSILTRGILFYWVYAAILVALGIMLFARAADSKSRARKILLVHGLALIPVWGYIYHNDRTHDVPMIATGSGAALYFGNNPATGGYEPPYFGLYHDEWEVIVPGSHLSPENDDRLKFAAKGLISDMGPATFIGLTMNKMAANMFFSKTGMGDELYQYRSARLILFFLAGVALVFATRNMLAVMLMGLLVYSVVILSPAMYNFRYSMGAIELPLILAAGMGVASLAAQPDRRRYLILAIGIAIWLAGMLHARHSSERFLDMTQPALQEKQLMVADSTALVTEGIRLPDAAAETGLFAPEHRKIQWQVPAYQSEDASPILTANFKTLDASCHGLRVTHDGASIQRARFATGENVEFSIGVALLGMGRGGGELLLEMTCAAGAAVELSSLQLTRFQYALKYRQEYDVCPGLPECSP